MKDYYRATRCIYQTSELLKERMALSANNQQGGAISFRDAVNARTSNSGKEIDGFILEGKTLELSLVGFRKTPFALFVYSTYYSNFLLSRTQPSNINSLVQFR